MGNVRAMRLMAAGVLMVTSSGPPALAQKDVEPGSRGEATRIVAEMRRIVTNAGVERLEKVRIVFSPLNPSVR